MSGLAQLSSTGVSDHRRLSISLPLYCEECGLPWEDFGERWLIYLSADDPPQAFSYCRECARREFED